MKILLLACVAIALFAISAAVGADDSASVQGVWKPVKAELAGEPLAPAALKAITLKIDGDRYEVTVDGAEATDRGTCRLDAASKPKRLTIVGTEGPNAGKTIPAIYEIRGGRLKVCYDLSGKAHPTAFKTAKGTQLFLALYQRQKR
jgi:uncharacterized protein (TIGR03067 family)